MEIDKMTNSQSSKTQWTIPLIRQTFELGKFISTAGKSIINLVHCEVWLQNIVKCGKFSREVCEFCILLHYAQKSVTTFQNMVKADQKALLL